MSRNAPPFVSFGGALRDIQETAAKETKNSSATTQNSPPKFCLFPDRAFPFHNSTPVTFQYSPVSPILNETPVSYKDSFLLIANLIWPFRCLAWM